MGSEFCYNVINIWMICSRCFAVTVIFRPAVRYIFFEHHSASQKSADTKKDAASIGARNQLSFSQHPAILLNIIQNLPGQTKSC